MVILNVWSTKWQTDCFVIKRHYLGNMSKCHTPSLNFWQLVACSLEAISTMLMSRVQNCGRTLEGMIHWVLLFVWVSWLGPSLPLTTSHPPDVVINAPSPFSLLFCFHVKPKNDKRGQPGNDAKPKHFHKKWYRWSYMGITGNFE